MQWTVVAGHGLSDAYSLVYLNMFATEGVFVAIA